MIRSLYTAVSGMIALEAKQDVITNNMANANTTAYKADDLKTKNFKEVMVQNRDKVVGGKNVTNKLGEITLGTRIDETYTKFTQGITSSTDRDTDFAIEGRGFFTVQRGNNTYYTRDGHFNINNEGYKVVAPWSLYELTSHARSCAIKIIMSTNNKYQSSENVLFENTLF